MPEQIILRPLQAPLIDKLREVRRIYQNVLFQAPTGFGKTHCFTYMAGRSYEIGDSVWIVVHLVELLEQVAARFDRFGVPYSYIASGYPSGDEFIKLCTIDTLIREMYNYPPPVWGTEDECHLVAANKYQKVREYTPHTRWVGTSGTPKRTDNKPLGHSYDYLLPGPQRKELQAVGDLVPCVLYYPPNDLDFSKCRKNENGEANLSDQAKELADKKIVGDVVKEYMRICPGVQFVVFAPTLDYCDIVAEAFTAAGIPTSVISSKLTKHQRRDVLTGYETGSIQGLVNVNLITSGVDVPNCGCIIWLRHTESEIIWDQGNGRAMRGHVPGKTCCYIIDHVGNCYTHGTEESFWPDCNRYYTLDPQVKKKKTKGPKACPLKRCEACAAMWEGGDTCPQCGWVQVPKEREIITVDGQLIMLTDDVYQQEKMLKVQLKRKLHMGLGRCRSPADFKQLAEEMGYPDPEGWAWAQWARRNKKRAVEI